MINSHNFRELGGLAGLDGRRVRTGLLYRSGHLAGLRRKDRAVLREASVGRIVDFRTEYEKRKSPDVVFPEQEYLPLSIGVGGEDIRREIRKYMFGRTHMDLPAFMEDINRKLVKEFTPAYRAWLRDMIDRDGALPQIFHCTAGKDRTGFAAALILELLGVPRKTIMEHYLLSNRFNTGVNRKIVRKINLLSLFRVKGEKLLPVLEVRPSYLRNAWDAIDAGWGGFSYYARAENGLNLSDRDLASLKEKLLDTP